MARTTRSIRAALPPELGDRLHALGVVSSREGATIARRVLSDPVGFASRDLYVLARAQNDTTFDARLTHDEAAGFHGIATALSMSPQTLLLNAVAQFAHVDLGKYPNAVKHPPYAHRLGALKQILDIGSAPISSGLAGYTMADANHVIASALPWSAVARAGKDASKEPRNR